MYKPILISLIVLLLIIFSVIFALTNMNNERIYSNIAIMNIDVSNLTKEEARKKITDILNEKLKEDIILKKDKYETCINANQIDGNFDIDSAIDKAYNVGKDGNIITNNYGILFAKLFGKKLECNFNYKEDVLDKKITDISAKMPNAFKDNSY